MSKCYSREEFLEKFKEVEHILIGNGFVLSHPELGKKFKWDMHAALDSSWNLILPDQSHMSAESDLRQIRINILKKILEYYIGALGGGEMLHVIYHKYKDGFNGWNCKNFLSNRKNIFSLNYDPVMYFEILNDARNFRDGFLGVNILYEQKEIVSKLIGSDRTNVYYVHGSWFIVADENNNLKKLSFGIGSSDDINTLFENNFRPHIILEDRWKVKKLHIMSEPNQYFRHCYNTLRSIEGELLIFGCSFETDGHILDAIKGNEKINEIYITYVVPYDLTRLQSIIQSKKVKYIRIDENVIWEKPAL